MMDYSVLPGNAPCYAPKQVKSVGHTSLTGKNVLYLGSSVTLGAAALEVSFAEYIAARNGNSFVKEAVSGTTLCDTFPGSYVARLKTVDIASRFDLFVCQLSTNDACRGLPVGKVTDETTDTVCGAIRHIVRYVRDTWHCPIVFYTGAYFDNATYAAMVTQLLKLSQSENFTVADMYSDHDFNAITKEAYDLYMADPIHPTRAGYLEWWTPFIEKALLKVFEK